MGPLLYQIATTLGTTYFLRESFWATRPLLSTSRRSILLFYTHVLNKPGVGVRSPFDSPALVLERQG